MNERCFDNPAKDASSRRNALFQGVATVLSLVVVPTILLSSARVAGAAVGSLAEWRDTNVILQGITVRVSDKSQQDAMINFLRDSFDLKVLRRRIAGTVEETWLGFGPEQLSVPADFTFPVSSFYEYGGHASIHLVYDSKDTLVYYNIGDSSAPGDNIAYLQLGVPTYRISQMAKNGGNILDAYGIVNVVSPSGLPMRGIVGIAPDPIMLIAINCVDVKQSQTFYEKLGFELQDYPFSRPSKGTGVFEPPQPTGSVYLAPTANGLGILLLQGKKKKQVKVNPAVVGLNLVYTEGSYDSDSLTESTLDPSGVGIRFQSAADFESAERQTR
jgi:catechol 2,3-dioxygenase-like lactoylglutathione lyase family enzyme